ncbi:MAG: trimethylamine methyltransferase family protein, partial [Candidatus Heimdallarchaeota archaeon]
MRPTIKILEEELKEKVVNEAFEVLEEIGFFVENEEAIEILQKAGIKVDKKNQRAKIPRDM